MSSLPIADPRRRSRRLLQHLAVFGAILAVQFVVFETALRVWGSSEAAPSFQGLFEADPQIGYRLKPGARMHFATPEFATDIAINNAGVRDDEDLGPKAPDERRIVLLGDSLVLSVQVPMHQTFGELLERRLNAESSGARYRVINAGVQGYGPVEEALYFEAFGARLAPDLVVVVVFVGNDAEEAFRSAAKFEPRGPVGLDAVRDSLYTQLRRLVRRSMVLQIVRLRVNMVRERLGLVTPPEPPLQSYAAKPAPRIAEGLAIARRSIERIAAAASAMNARTAIVLMPARFQLDDGDYGRLKTAVAQTGGELVRDAATRRFEAALAPLSIPRLDLLPALRATGRPGPELFFQANVHLTPLGHRVVAGALADFLRQQRLLAQEDER